MSLEQIFATPIWVADIDPELSLQISPQIERELARRAITDQPWDDQVKSTFTFQGSNDLRRFKLARLEQWIHSELEAYCASLGYDSRRLALRDSWFNQFDGGDFMYDHCHPGNLISGCYYHRAQEGQGNLRFMNPNPLMLNRQWPADQQPWQQGWRVESRTGRLVMFPSWLMHRVEPNRSTATEPRISLAFNIG